MPKTPMSNSRILAYALAFVSLAILGSASITLTVVALDSPAPIVLAKQVPKLPKPTLGCPDCRDATLAAVKESP